MPTPSQESSLFYRRRRHCPWIRFRCLTEEVVRAGPGAGGAVFRIEESAALERQATAADAPGQLVPQRLQLGDAVEFWNSCSQSRLSGVRP